MRAVIHYDYGFEVNQFEGLAVVEIKLRKEFQLTRLLSSGDVRHSFQLRPSHRWQIAVNDAGQVAFVGSLDGMATSLLLYENDRFDLLVSGGTPLASSQRPGGLIAYFQSPAINNRGQVLAHVAGFREPGGLMLADRSGSSLVVPWWTPIGGNLALDNFRITSHSLNDSGEALFRAGIRSADFGSDIDPISALFRLSNGSLEFVWSTAPPLPGLADPIDFQDFGIDGRGTVYFLIFDESKNALYRVSRSSQPEKIIGVGDEFAGSTVRGIGAGDAGSLAVAEDGDVAFSVHLENGGQHVVRLSSGQMESLPVRDLGRVFAVSNAAEVLFEGNAGRGWGLYRWDRDTATPVLLQDRLAPNEEPIRQIDAAAMTSQGQVFAQVRTAENDFVVLQPGGSSPLLFQAGDPVNVTSNLLVHSGSLIPGSSSGPARALLGNPGSVVELGPRGPLPQLIIGDRLSSGAGFGGADYAAEDSLGRLYLLSEGGLLRLTSRRVETVLPRGFQSDDGLGLYLNEFEVNDSGVVVFSAGTDRGDQRLYLWRRGRLDQLATDGQTPEEQTSSPAGGTFFYWREFSVDALSRVMAYFDVRDGPSGYFLYDNGQWQPTALVGERIGGVTVSDGFSLRAMDDKFYTVIFSAQCCNQAVLAEYRQNAWTPLITSENALPRGELAEVGLGGLFDVNRRGEIAFIIHGALGEALVLRSPDGTRIVHITGQETEAGDLLWNYRGVDLRDDGRLYFTALDVNDQVSIYEAESLSAPPVPTTRRRIPPRSRARGR